MAVHHNFFSPSFFIHKKKPSLRTNVFSFYFEFPFTAEAKTQFESMFSIWTQCMYSTHKPSMGGGGGLYIRALWGPRCRKWTSMVGARQHSSSLLNHLQPKVSPVTEKENVKNPIRVLCFYRRVNSRTTVSKKTLLHNSMLCFRTNQCSPHRRAESLLLQISDTPPSDIYFCYRDLPKSRVDA